MNIGTNWNEKIIYFRFFLPSLLKPLLWALQETLHSTLGYVCAVTVFLHGKHILGWGESAAAKTQIDRI